MYTAHWPSVSVHWPNVASCSVRVLGTCSLCGGNVTIPTVWWSTCPPTPSCSRCGAQAKLYYGPVIPMVLPPAVPSLPSVPAAITEVNYSIQWENAKKKLSKVRLT